MANAYPHLRHLVFSWTLGESPDPGVEIVTSDPAAKVRELKQEDGKDIWLVGGAEPASALHSEFDRLVVKLSPMTIGGGIPFFSHKAAFDPRTWERTDHTVLDSGAAFLTYVRRADAFAPGA